MSGRYDFGYQVYHGSTVEWALKKIRPKSEVLEFGPFNGNLTKHLKEELLCQVDIVELDEEAGNVSKQFAREALIGKVEGDIENFFWENKFKGKKYDYIVFLDVIEHLIQTKQILNKVRFFLKENGLILLTIPNIAYNGILINLLNNRFQYTERGLLDSTHLRFFTYESIIELGKELNYDVDIDALQLPVSDSETNTSYDMIPQKISHYLQQREYANVYQYLVELKERDGNEKTTRLTIENVDNKVLFCIYFLNGNNKEYSEEKKLYKYVQVGKDIQADFDLEMIKEITSIRLDPMDCACYLKNISVWIECLDGKSVELKMSKSNGINIENGILFFTDDPQIYFENIIPNCKKLRFRCELISYDKEQLNQLETVCLVYNKELEKIKRDLLVVKETLRTEQNIRKEVEIKWTEQQEESEKIKISLEEEKKNVKMVNRNLKKQILNFNNIQRENELLKNDLQIIMHLKDISEERLYQIESSRSWRLLQCIVKIKSKLIGNHL